MTDIPQRCDRIHQLLQFSWSTAIQLNDKQDSVIFAHRKLVEDSKYRFKRNFRGYQTVNRWLHKVSWSRWILQINTIQWNGKSLVQYANCKTILNVVGVVANVCKNQMMSQLTVSTNWNIDRHGDIRWACEKTRFEVDSGANYRMIYNCVLVSLTMLLLPDKYK